MSSTNEMLLAELMTTKYCHDLAGPLGAVGNGVELLKEGDEAMQEMSIELLENSAKEAIERLLFFRQAFGATNKQMDVEMSLIEEICCNFFRQKKIDVSWQVDELFNAMTGEARHQLVKLLLNVMMASTHLVIYGASMHVEITAGKKQGLNVTLTHEKLKDDPDVESILCQLDHLPDMDSRNVQLFFTSSLIKNASMKTTLKKSDDTVSINVSQ